MYFFRRLKVVDLRSVKCQRSPVNYLWDYGFNMFKGLTRISVI